jgi:hypothetical protein
MHDTESDKMMDYFHPDGPFRVPHWRWGWANRALERLPVLRSVWRDEWASRAVRYLRRSRHAVRPDAPELASFDPACHTARNIAYGDPRTIFEIQLRVLAGQSRQSMAESCGISVNVIEAFEALFYDLRPRLLVEDYIYMVIAPHPVLRAGVEGFRTVIRTGAYATGYHAVDLLLRVYDERLYPSRLAGKPDPNPALTSKVRESIDFTFWCNLPISDLQTCLTLHRLLQYSEATHVNLDIAELMRPVSSVLWRGVTPRPAHTRRLLRQGIPTATRRAKRHRPK